MQTTNTKDRRITKKYKKNMRPSQEMHLNSLLSFHLKKQMTQVQEETEEQQKIRLEMSNLYLFFDETKNCYKSYPSSFALIRDIPHVDHHFVRIQHLRQPSFPVLSYKIKQLISFVPLILESNSYAQQCYSKLELQELITIIAQNYNSVSYHNFSHAFNLMLINYQCIDRQNALKKLYTEEEIFYIIIAGISHDLGHKGTNNQFQIKCQSDLAKASHNQSVLQNMHIRTLWKILAENPHINFMKFASDEKKAKHIITRLILKTDMQFHTSGLETLRTLKSNNSLVLTTQSDHKWFIMEQIFHGSDIGNPCLDYDSYMSWAALLSYEFNEQTRLQEKMGLEVTRGFVFKNVNSLYSDQEWFLRNIVQPLWKQIADIFPNLTIYCENIKLNLEKIKEEAQLRSTGIEY